MPTEGNSQIAELTADLDTLCSQANNQLETFPLATQRKLTKETGEIFERYSQHGSQERLKHNLSVFLAKRDEGLGFTQRSPPPKAFTKTSRTLDDESRVLVRELPFHLAQTFEIDPNVNLPPYLLPYLDRVFGLYEAEAKALLKHHCEKYGDEAIFRVGIREYMQSHLTSILESTTSDTLNLSPSTREFLRSVYESHPDLNLAEKRMLSRATRLGRETIEFFWDDMAAKRKAYMGMRQFVAARELERSREEAAALRVGEGSGEVEGMLLRNQRLRQEEEGRRFLAGEAWVGGGAGEEVGGDE